MKVKYCIEYSGVTSGTMMGRDDGHPCRKTMIVNDYISAGEKLKQIIESTRKPYGYKPPVVWALEPEDVAYLIESYELFEKTKNRGADI